MVIFRWGDCGIGDCCSDRIIYLEMVTREDYGEDWSEISIQLKFDAEWKCGRCGEKHNPGNYYILTIHHLYGVREGILFHAEVWCQRCHLKDHGCGMVNFRIRELYGQMNLFKEV